MRVFLIAAVLAVFATSAEARCYPPNAIKELENKVMSKYACDCIKDEIIEWMSLLFLQ